MSAIDLRPGAPAADGLSARPRSASGSGWAPWFVLLVQGMFAVWVLWGTTDVTVRAACATGENCSAGAGVQLDTVAALWIAADAILLAAWLVVRARRRSLAAR